MRALALTVVTFSLFGCGLYEGKPANSSCDKLDESTCESTPGCHAVEGEVSAPPGAPPDNLLSCASASVEGGNSNDCASYDETTCAKHDVCISWMYGNGQGGFEFELCSDNPSI